MIEITVFTKLKGPLTKRIRLAEDGSILSDSSACKMGQGTARRMEVANAEQLAALIEQLHPNQAIALGRLRADLPDQVEIVTKSQLNGCARPDVIARTGSNILFRDGQAAFALKDFDSKGMPQSVTERLAAMGGFMGALGTVLPGLGDCAHVVRRSTSSGLVRSDTGQQLPGSDGLHCYVAVQDGGDIERFLATLHQRCWLHGLGWMMVGAGGQLLERSIIDRMVGAPERLVFEGAPILEPPLRQDAALRRASVTEGGLLDTVSACPPIKITEAARLSELRAKEAYRLAGEVAKVRAAFIEKHAAAIAQRTGMWVHAARRVATSQTAGVLLPSVVLPFDDEELAGCTVADVLADPERFEGATLADPLEGVGYGTCKAKIMRRADGQPWIHSFAHGRSIYELKLDTSAAAAQIEQAEGQEAADLFIHLALTAELDETEVKQLLDLAAERAGVGVRPLMARLKGARKQRAEQQARQRAEHRTAQRRDPRVQLPVPYDNAPWLPQMQSYNEVISAPKTRRTRNIDDALAQVRMSRVPNTHAFTDANTEEEEE